MSENKTVPIDQAPTTPATEVNGVAVRGVGQSSQQQQIPADHSTQVAQQQDRGSLSL